MKKWNIVLMAPSNGDQTITVYNIVFAKTRDSVLDEPKFIYFIKKHELNKIYSKGFELISAVTIESDDPNNRIISKYSIKVDSPYYSLKVKDSRNKSVF